LTILPGMEEIKSRLAGRLVRLRPATPADRRPIFAWLTRSDLTCQMLGPPRFPDNPVPSWEEFTADYAAFYFDGSRPDLGRCFIIEVNRQPVGQINYDLIDGAGPTIELDIWLSASAVSGQGYGPDAIITLCDYLREAFGRPTFVIAPSARNTRAVRAYQNAGFHPSTQVPPGFVPDYTDTVILTRQ
jgi:RimJ/RimL family protein N-acetyltransferase